MRVTEKEAHTPPLVDGDDAGRSRKGLDRGVKKRRVDLEGERLLNRSGERRRLKVEREEGLEQGRKNGTKSRLTLGGREEGPLKVSCEKRNPSTLESKFCDGEETKEGGRGSSASSSFVALHSPSRFPSSPLLAESQLCSPLQDRESCEFTLTKEA